MQNDECIYIGEQFTDYQENSLTSETRARVDAHLTVCSSCRDIYQELNRVLDQLHEFPSLTTKPDFTQNLMSKIDDLNHQSPWQRVYQSSFTRVAGYAIAAGLIVALGLNIWIDPISPNGIRDYTGRENPQIQPMESIADNVDSLLGNTADSLKIPHRATNSGTSSLQLVSDTQ